MSLLENEFLQDVVETINSNIERVKNKKVYTYMDRFSAIQIPYKYRSVIKDEDAINDKIQKENPYYKKGIDVFVANGMLTFFVSEKVV